MSCPWTLASRPLPRACPVPWSMPRLSSRCTSKHDCHHLVTCRQRAVLQCYTVLVNVATPSTWAWCVRGTQVFDTAMHGCSFVERFQKLLARACELDRDLTVSHPCAGGHVAAVPSCSAMPLSLRGLSLKSLVPATGLADCTVRHARWQLWVAGQAESSSACRCITA